MVVVAVVVVVRAAADDVAWHLAVWEPFRNSMHGLLVRGCIDVSFLCASRHGMHPPHPPTRARRLLGRFAMCIHMHTCGRRHVRIIHRMAGVGTWFAFDAAAATAATTS